MFTVFLMFSFFHMFSYVFLCFSFVFHLFSISFSLFFPTLFSLLSLVFLFFVMCSLFFPSLFSSFFTLYLRFLLSPSPVPLSFPSLLSLSPLSLCSPMCRLWFLLPGQSFVHGVSSADPFTLEGPLSVLFNDAIALHHCLRKVCDGLSKSH